jgi:hypothetical protein
MKTVTVHIPDTAEVTITIDRSNCRPVSFRDPAHLDILETDHVADAIARMIAESSLRSFWRDAISINEDLTARRAK